MPATTEASGSGDASTDLIAARSHSCHQGRRLNLRIFKLLISCCLLTLCIYPNAWHLSIGPGSGSGSGLGLGSGSIWVSADSIKGRGDAHRLDEMGPHSHSHTSFSASVPSSWLTQSNNHANISELLDNLLRGYDNSIRPDFGGKYIGGSIVPTNINSRIAFKMDSTSIFYLFRTYFLVPRGLPYKFK